MRIVVLIAVAVSLTMVQTAAAQETQAPPPAEPAEQDATPDDDQSVKEVGGRLIVDGGTVLVAPDPDLPPQDSSIATKTDTRLIETPRSVSVTDRRTLDDRLAVNISDAHDYTVGVTPMDDRGPAFARGFRIDFYDLRRDGLRTYTWSVREPVGLERVQYLRGPASVLYGDGSPGGLVNLMLKKPLPVRRTEVTASIGELGFGRFTADQTGPVGGNRRVRYRLIGAGESTKNAPAPAEQHAFQRVISTQRDVSPHGGQLRADCAADQRPGDDPQQTLVDQSAPASFA